MNIGDVSATGAAPCKIGDAHQDHEQERRQR
jgi:hypothetical protein